MTFYDLLDVRCFFHWKGTVASEGSTFFWLKEDPQFMIQNWSLQSLIVVYKGPWGLSQPHFNHRPKIPQEGQIKTCHGGFTYLEISKISDVSSIWLISTQWQWRKTLDCHNSLFGASCYGVDPKKNMGAKKPSQLVTCHRLKGEICRNMPSCLFGMV